MKLIARQKIWLSIVLVANLLLWIIPSHVAEQIAHDQHTMLGRYSTTYFKWIVAVAVFSLVSIYVDLARGEKYKKRWFQVLAALLALIPVLGILDVILRAQVWRNTQSMFISRVQPTRQLYVKDTLAYHRPAGASFLDVVEDRPFAARTYPNTPPGYGKIECTLRVDRRGFRNQTDGERYDVVALGDSFTEGLGVSDEQTWPARLVAKSGLAVYNLGMSGYDPMHYLAALEEHGLALEPRFVVCMFYEGNDFRSGRHDRKRRNPSFSKRVSLFFERSPILNALDTLLIQTFGPLNCKGFLKGAEALDWLPLAVPEGSDAVYYRLLPEQLRNLRRSRAELAASDRWLNPRDQLDRMNEICAGAGCRFIVVYAPTKAHVLIPLVADRLPPEKVRAFASLGFKGELPEAGRFLADLQQNAEARESLVHQWCKSRSIPFVSTTEALRAATLDATQAYLTYDEHWTPQGQEIAAEVIHRFLAAGFPPDPERSASPGAAPSAATGAESARKD